jgi:hypothetical protein
MLPSSMIDVQEYLDHDSSFGIPMIESAESRLGVHLTVNGDLRAKRRLFSDPSFSRFADRSAISRSAR